MFKRATLVCIMLFSLPTAILAWSQQESASSFIRILVEGEPPLSRSFIEAIRRNNAKYHLRLEFVGKPDDPHDLRLIVSSGSGTTSCSAMCSDPGISSCSASFSYHNIVALTPNGKLLFILTSARQGIDAISIELIRKIYSQSASLKDKSTPVSSVPQEALKPDQPIDTVKASDQEPPAEPGIYYKSGVEWIRLTEAVAGTDVKGTGAWLFTFGIAPIRVVKAYSGMFAKFHVPERKPEFYVRDFPISEQDVRIVRLKVVARNREVQVSSGTHSWRNQYNPDSLHQVIVTRISDGVHKLVPASELPSGEYVLHLYISDLSTSGYDFGIRPPKK
jgi:hypothetical protein